MHFYSIWNPAGGPNYSTNVDLEYPYSDIPHQGNLNYLKIPVSSTDIVKHVDYWGEGRVVSGRGISGFPNSFNVNHQYRLVSSGPDKDKKIPNRIPLVSYDDCDTSAFIRDNSVLIVTVPRARLSSNCVRDIARMINDKRGNVVVYSKHGDSDDISELTAALKTKGLLRSDNATLDCELLGLTYFDSHVAFITTGKNEKDINALKKDLANFLEKGDYDAAVYISQFLGEAVSEIVTKIIRSAPQNVMAYAYKLWHSGNQDVVREHFPKPFQYIISQAWVNILNKQYNTVVRPGYRLKDGTSTNVVFACKIPNTTNHTSTRLAFHPTYERGKVTFVLRNAYWKFLELVDDEDGGDSHCLESEINSTDEITDDRFKFSLESSIGGNGDVVFIIINSHKKQRLKLDTEEKQFGPKNIPGRAVRGHNISIVKVNDNFRWIIEKFPHGGSLLLRQNFDDASESD